MLDYVIPFPPLDASAVIAITDARYYTKTEIDGIEAALVTMFDDFYTKSETDTLLTSYYTKIASDARYYTQSQVDTMVSDLESADAVIDAKFEDYYTSVEVDTQFGFYYNKVDSDARFAPISHNHDSRYYTETEVDGFLAGKSDTSHTHDGRYYTETEMDTLLAAKLAITNFNNRPRFAAYGSGPGFNASTNLVFKPNVITLNVGSAYSSSTGRFTCPAAGEYKIGYKGLEGSPGAYASHSQLWKNGTSVSVTHHNHTNYGMGHLFYQGTCAAGDYFEVVQMANYSIYVAVNTVYNWFWGERTDF